mgnify:CR=1 FL=1
MNIYISEHFKKGELMWFICYPDITPVKELPFYTISVGMHLWQYPTPRENGYPYPQFLYSNKGSGKLITGASAGCAVPFSLALIEALRDTACASHVAQQIVLR